MAKGRSKKTYKPSGKIPTFPIDVFPDHVQEALTTIARAKYFSLNYIAASFLVACGAAFDRHYVMRTPNNHTAIPSLWLITVGNAGASKSEPIKVCFQPFYDYNLEEEDRYEKDQEEMKHAMQGSKMINGALKKIDRNKTRITSNATTESIFDICSKQNTGILVHPDEILSFLNGMDAYRAGKNSIDKEFWLSAFNGNSYTTTRKTAGSSTIKSLTVSIMGSIQFHRIGEAFGSSVDVSGFLDRFLFVVAKENPPKWTKENNEDSVDAEKMIHGIINMILGIHDPQVRLNLDKGATGLLIDWQNEIVDEMVEEMTEAEVSTAKKDEIYINRFVLLLYLINNIQGFPPISDESKVDKDSVHKAIRLMDYFKENREYMRRQIQENTSEVDYPMIKQEIRKAGEDKKTLRLIVRKYREKNVSLKWFEEHMPVHYSTIRRWK